MSNSQSEFPSPPASNRPADSFVTSTLVAPASAPFRRIPRIRTTAYWQYGPVSPSKLSASLKSNAIIALRVNFSRKNRSSHRDGMRSQLLFLGLHLPMPLLHFRQRRRLQLVQQIICLHPKAFAPAHFHIRLLRLFRRAPRRQRHNLIRQVNRPLRFFLMPERPQSRCHHLLQIRLPRINHVVDARCRLPKVRRPRIIRPARRSPNRVPLRRIRPLPVAEILPQQSKFPQLVSNIFPDVRHRAIRTHNNLVLRILFLFYLLCVLRVLCALCVSSRIFFFLPRQDPATRHLPARRQLNRARFLQHFERRIPELQVQ